MRDICKNYEEDCDNCSYICPCLAFENNNDLPRNKPINETAEEDKLTLYIKDSDWDFA